jgi:protein-L-isoaspartate(D-aspartate) O-methyltransferase
MERLEDAMTDTTARAEERERMVERQLVARGIRDHVVLAAMRAVPREAFIAGELAEFAYEDAPLPIDAGQTISQPYIVAQMIVALELDAGARVLEVGTGSGYAAAVLSRIAREVYTIERHAELADAARRRLSMLGYTNVRVLHGDGTVGWAEHAPYDGIVVAAGGPDVPKPLHEQLTVGGRLVIPIGPTPREQTLVRVTRTGPDTYEREDLGAVRFVPLIGAQGWADGETPIKAPRVAGSTAVTKLVREAAEPIGDIDGDAIDALIDRIGDARVVLLGEATHGTSEFYRMRARITRELIMRRGFTIVAIEGDWPDAARVDHWVRHLTTPPAPWKAFTRFPTWMWRNREVERLVGWLRQYNGAVEAPERRVGFHGLDLYSLYTSLAAVLRYLDEVDPEAARVARARYASLTPWQGDPAAYGRAVLSHGYRSCEAEVVAMLRDLLERRLDYMRHDGDRFLDALQNARVVANAEQYYRIMYYGSAESWNLRDQHMFETLRVLLAFRGPDAKAVVWEHNSHVGNAAATEMSVRGELNVGQLARAELGDAVFSIGFGTDHGTVAAASDWDGPMEVKRVRPAHADSYERLCHDAAVAAFFLPLREPRRPDVRGELMAPRLERAIGVIYRPETELASHYFQAVLPEQFDEYVWFDETRAVTPLAALPPDASEVSQMSTFGRILVPIDYSAGADDALRVAGGLARAFQGRLIVLHLLPSALDMLAEFPLMPLPDDDWKAQEASRLEAHVEAVLAPEGALPTYEVVAEWGLPNLDLVPCAIECRADLIVMGTHGRTGLRHVVLGSVAEKTVRFAPCPVLTVRAGAAADRALGRVAVEPARQPVVHRDVVDRLVTRMPVTVNADDLLSTARQRMVRERIRHLAVVEDGRLVGILSDRDLAAHLGQLEHTRVNAAMTPHPTTITPDAPVETAARLMIERRVRALPVVDGAHIVGMLAATDILEEYVRAARRAA